MRETTDSLGDTSLSGNEKVNLMTNNPDKVEQLSEYGINVVERMEIVAGVGTETWITYPPRPENGASNQRGQPGKQ